MGDEKHRGIHEDLEWSRRIISALGAVKKGMEEENDLSEMFS